MDLSCKVGFALATLGLAALPHAALAQKFVLSGDVNIGNGLDNSFTNVIDPGNQRFFQNILGSGTKVVQQNGYNLGSTDAAETAINNFYNGLPGVTASQVSGPITTATLAGADLFIDVLPTLGLTTSEVSALHDFSASGGTIFFLGDNSVDPTVLGSDGFINSDLTALNSSLHLVPDAIDSDFHTISGSNIAANPLTAGVSSFKYAATSQVTGGTSLFFTQTGSLPFVAETGFPSVPEASTTASFGLLFALGLGGFIAVGKRRKSVG